MGRTARILTWSAGILVGLIVLTVGAAYFFVTSDDFRSRVESSASAYSGRKTHIAKIIDRLGLDRARSPGRRRGGQCRLGQGRPHAEGRAGRLRHPAVAVAQGRYRPAATSVLRKPEVAVEVGDKEQLNWSLGESPVTTGLAKAAAPKERTEMPLVGHLEITDGRLSYQDTKRKLALDGTVSTAEGKAGAQPQAELSLKGKLENQPLTVHFVGGSALMLRDTDAALSDRSQCRLWRHQAHAEGDRAGSLPVDRRQRRSHARPGRTCRRSTRCWAFPDRRRRPIGSAASSTASPACGSS